MRITISIPALSRTLRNSSERPNAVTLSASDEHQAAVDALSHFLPRKLADLGVIGGHVSIHQLDSARLHLTVTFWAPEQLADEELELLREFTIDQMKDGIGESGFWDARQHSLVMPNLEESIKVTQEGDTCIVPPVPVIAIYARDSRLDSLRRELEAGGDPNVIHQGYPALQLAILHGNLDAAELLLVRGADANSRSVFGDTPLFLCATSRSIDDAQAVWMADRLVSHGASRDVTSGFDDTACEIAAKRNRPRLAALLRGSP